MYIPRDGTCYSYILAVVPGNFYSPLYRIDGNSLQSAGLHLRKVLFSHAQEAPLGVNASAWNINLIMIQSMNSLHNGTAVHGDHLKLGFETLLNQCGIFSNLPPNAISKKTTGLEDESILLSFYLCNLWLF